MSGGWRHPQPGTPSRAERVDHIVERMRQDEWEPGETAELAKRWGLSELTVNNEAMEASRRVRSVFDPDVARAQFDALVAEAVAEARQASKAADRARLLLEAAGLIARVTGCGAPQKVALTRADGSEVQFGWEPAPAEERKDH